MVFQSFGICVQAAGTDLDHRTSAEDSVSLGSSRAGILHGHIYYIESRWNHCTQNTNVNLINKKKTQREGREERQMDLTNHT